MRNGESANCNRQPDLLQCGLQNGDPFIRLIEEYEMVRVLEKREVDFVS
jgi:hypothetical protein